MRGKAPLQNKKHNASLKSFDSVIGSTFSNSVINNSVNSTLPPKDSNHGTSPSTNLFPRFMAKKSMNSTFSKEPASGTNFHSRTTSVNPAEPGKTTTTDFFLTVAAKTHTDLGSTRKTFTRDTNSSKSLYRSATRTFNSSKGFQEIQSERKQDRFLRDKVLTDKLILPFLPKAGQIIDLDDYSELGHPNTSILQRKVEGINFYREKVKIDVSRQDAINFAILTQKNMINDCIKNNFEFEKQRYVLETAVDEKENEEKIEDPFMVNIPLKAKPLITRESDIDGTKWKNIDYTIKKNFKARALLFDEKLIAKPPQERKNIALMNYVQTLIRQGPQNKNLSHKIILVVENYNLDTCLSKNHIRFAYVKLPLENRIKSEKEIFNDFQEFSKEIKERLNVNMKESYLFLKNGDPIQTHLQIPPDQYTIILSPNPLFKGLGKVSESSYQVKVLNSIFNSLEKPLKKLSKVKKDFNWGKYITFEDNVKKNYKSVINDVITLLETDKGITSHKLEDLDLKLEKALENNDQKISHLLETLERPQKQKSNRGERKKTELLTNFHYKSKEEYLKDDEELTKTSTFRELSRITDLYDNALKKIKFNTLEVRESDEEERNNAQDLMALDDISPADLRKISKRLDQLITKWHKSLKFEGRIKKKNKADSDEKSEPTETKENEDDEQEDEDQKEEPSLGDINIDIDQIDKENQKKDFIKINKKKYYKSKSLFEDMRKTNDELMFKNIPKIMRETKFTRRELHSFYILYKSLANITALRHENYKQDEGLDFHTFFSGIKVIFVQSEDYANRVFSIVDKNGSGYLDWEEFIKLMVSMRTKTLEDRINLFIKIADGDGNGMLSKDEILNLCRIALKRYIKVDEVLELLCEYFTELIFISVGIDINEEIPLMKIKDAILSGNEEADLLSLFCGAQ